MLTGSEILQLIGSLIWLIAGVGVFIVGMNFMSDVLEKSAGSGMKRMLEKISNNRLSGVGISSSLDISRRYFYRFDSKLVCGDRCCYITNACYS